MSIYLGQFSYNMGEDDIYIKAGIDTFYKQGAIIIGDPEHMEYPDTQCRVGLYFKTVEAFDKFLEIAKKTRDSFEKYMNLSGKEQAEVWMEYDNEIIDSFTRI